MTGWAWRPEEPSERVLVHVFVGGRFFGQGRADIARADLRNIGIGDGGYGFRVTAPFGAPPFEADDEIRVFAVGPRWTELTPPSGGEPSPAEAPIADVRQYLRRTFAAGFWAPPSRAAGARSGASAAACERLVAASPIPGPPPALGRPVGAYLDHVRHKWNVAEDFEPTNSLRDYDAYLRHYLIAYVGGRSPLRVPLSADEIAHLNAGPDDAHPEVPTGARRLFADHFAASASSGDDVLADIHLWAAHHALQFGGEDCLVPECWRERLRAPIDPAVDYPLSPFMASFAAENAFLRTVDTTTVAGRRTILLAIALFAVTTPHLLQYVPARSLDAYLAPDAAGLSPFERDLHDVLPELALDRARWRDAVEASGLVLAEGRFRTLTAAGHRLQAAFVGGAGAEVDVQIIGPFSRRLGVSDSCHMLAAALAKLPITLRCCDHALDHPNARRTDVKLALEPPGPAKINVVHLNLEELPSVFAYFPDVFETAYNVACPYTEVAPPHAAQRLGLTLVDEIWSASSFITETLGGFRPTHTMGTAARATHPLGRAAARREVLDGLVGPDDFVFLTAGDALSGVFRKNPLGTIRAFLAAFPADEKVRLVVKVHSLDKIDPSSPDHRIWQWVKNIVEECDRVVLLDRLLTDREQAALIEGADCLVSLHRAEGFGYHMLEAMVAGTPVVATGYSGNVD
ncbi:MAG: glycosyltransferase family 4 protein, partial [Phyllobacteriaceae bacterium]|nr:glycosyltransferase family 4 protein [Phyllobacteriaceae bacterium]